MTQFSVNISYVEKRLKEFGVDEGLINELKGSYQDLIKRSWDTDIFFYNFLNKKLKDMEKRKQQGEEVRGEAEKLAYFTAGLVRSGLVTDKNSFHDFVTRNLWPYIYVGEKFREFQKAIYAGFKGATGELVVNLDINDVEKKLREAGIDESLLKEFREAYQDLVKDAFDNDHVFYRFIEKKMAKIRGAKNYTPEEVSQLQKFVDKLLELKLVEWKYPFENFSNELSKYYVFNKEQMKQIQKGFKKGLKEYKYYKYHIFNEKQVKQIKEDFKKSPEESDSKSTERKRNLKR